MRKDVSPSESPIGSAFQDPELIDAIARSFAYAQSIQAVTAAVDRNMSRIFSPGSWSLHLSGSPDRAGSSGPSGQSDPSRQSPHGLPLPGESRNSRDSGSPGRGTWLSASGDALTRVPLLREGAVLGWIDLDSALSSGVTARQPEPPAGFVRLVADYAAIALHNALEISRIQALAIIDDCTGLYNSRHLSSVLTTEIERSRRFHLPFSVLFIDLDYFKKVNDAHGHMAGSWLLARVAETIRSSIRGIDSAFRYGGDEFVVLLPQTGKEPGLEVGVRLLKAFRVNHHLYSPDVSLAARASIGLAAYPEDGQTAEDLILAADAAMYRVKNTTRDNLSAAGSGCALESGE